MRKWVLGAFAFIILIIPKALDFVGYAGTPDNLNQWGRLMNSIGLTNFLSLILFCFATWLFYQEYHDRKQASLSSRLTYLYRKRSLSNLWSPIKWLDYSNFLQHSGYSITGCRLPEDNDFLRKYIISISGFRLLGKNKCNKALRIKDAFIQSLVSGRKLPILIDGYPIDEIEQLPANHVFTVSAAFEPKSNTPEINGQKIHGIPIGLFRREFSFFRFVFETENYRHDETFNKEEIDFLLYQIVTGLEWDFSGEKQPLYIE